MAKKFSGQRPQLPALEVISNLAKYDEIKFTSRNICRKRATLNIDILKIATPLPRSLDSKWGYIDSIDYIASRSQLLCKNPDGAARLEPVSITGERQGFENCAIPSQLIVTRCELPGIDVDLIHSVEECPACSVRCHIERKTSKGRLAGHRR